MRNTTLVAKTVLLALAVPSVLASPGPPTQPVLPHAGAAELYRRTDQGYEPLPLVDLAVHLDVTGLMVHGTVVQVFQNPAAEVIEALYVFPLPEAAAIHFMEMTIGPRRIVSVVQERQEARRTYEAARAEGRKAALVEQARPNLFTTSVAGINPGETVIVTLEFLQEASYEDGELGLAFPLTYTPRFDPGNGAAPGLPDQIFSWAVPRARVSVRLDAGFDLEAAVPASHRLEERWDGEALILETPEEGVPADRDLVLRWRPRLGAGPTQALFTEERDSETYHLLMVLPPAPDGDAGQATETLFVLDVSGSMAGPSMEQAREALLAALDLLRPDDMFNLLAFNDRVSALQEEFLPALEVNLEDARNWVRRLEAGGGTQIHPALLAGLEMMQSGRAWRSQRIILLTDGAVANEAQVIQTLLARLGSVRLHTLGIGHAPNRYLMKKMASTGHGLCGFITTTSGAGNRIRVFLERLARPVLTDLDVAWDGPGEASVLPARFPDLHAGEPLWISLRATGEGHLVLSGRLADGPWRVETQVGRLAPPGSGVATRWARAKVEALTDSLMEGADAGAVRREVVDLALDFNLVTRFTSLVAVEEIPSVVGPVRTARVGSTLPAGSAPGVLPQGGTLDRLLVLLGCLLLAAGTILVAAWIPSRARHRPASP